MKGGGDKMSEAKKIIPMQAWAILDPERYIKKSIKDWSLAIYDEKISADRQIESISSANNEECFIEELSICNKVKLDEYITVHNEMYEFIAGLYEVLCLNGGVIELVEDDCEEMKELISKARGK